MNIPLSEPVLDHAAIEPKTITVSAPMARQSVVHPLSRILYVDDDVSMRKVGQLILGGSGYIVKTVADGVEAWTALRNSHYDLLITDDRMPRLTGLELIRQVRRARMTVPIILTSGIFGAVPSQELSGIECAAALPKPFSPEQLLATVQEMLLKESRRLHLANIGRTNLLVEEASTPQRFMAGGN